MTKFPQEPQLIPASALLISHLKIIRNSYAHSQICRILAHFPVTRFHTFKESKLNPLGFLEILPFRQVSGDALIGIQAPCPGTGSLFRRKKTGEQSEIISPWSISTVPDIIIIRLQKCHTVRHPGMLFLN